MAQDEIKKYLDKGRGGTPLINPDEQHKYLGTFRERCYLTLTIEQFSHPQNQQALAKELQQHPEALLLLNGAMASSLQTLGIQLAGQKNCRFTVINDFVTNDPHSYGAILTADKAVNEPVVDVEAKYPLPKETATSQKKSSFWQKLFGG